MNKVLFTLIILLLSSFQDKERIKKLQLFRQLYDLEGTWLMETNGNKIVEIWGKKNDSLMKSISFSIRNSDTMYLEQVELRLLGSKILYLPVVNGQNDNRPVLFSLVFARNMEFHFENRFHDFPQKIIYHLIRRDSIHAYTEGVRKGKMVRTNFYYKRISN